MVLTRIQVSLVELTHIRLRTFRQIGYKFCAEGGIPRLENNPPRGEWQDRPRNLKGTPKPPLIVRWSEIRELV